MTIVDRVHMYRYAATADKSSSNQTPTVQPLPLNTGIVGTGDPIADDALANARKVDEYLSSHFQRDGYDGKGTALDVVVHAPEPANAYWVSDQHRIEIGDGDGKLFSEIAKSPSVIAHEIYHGVVDSEVRLDYGVTQEAALNESLADVFAAGVAGSWRIGEDVYTPTVPGDPIRDLAAPEVGNMRDADKARGEAHALSGIPSLAAVRVASAIGADAMQKVWYDGLTQHLNNHSGFAGAARATQMAAAALYGTDSKEFAAVSDAWKSVGVNAGWTPQRRSELDRISRAIPSA